MKPDMLRDGVEKYMNAHVDLLFGKKFEVMVEEKKKRDRIENSIEKRRKKMEKTPLSLGRSDTSDIVNVDIFFSRNGGIGVRAYHCMLNFTRRESEKNNRTGMTVNKLLSYFPDIEKIKELTSRCGIKTAVYIAEVIKKEYGAEIPHRRSSAYRCPHCFGEIGKSELKPKLPKAI